MVSMYFSLTYPAYNGYYCRKKLVDSMVARTGSLMELYYNFSSKAMKKKNIDTLPKTTYNKTSIQYIVYGGSYADNRKNF